MFKVAHEGQSKKTKSMVVSRSRTYAHVYGDFTHDGAKLEEIKSVRILGVIVDSKLRFETHLCEGVSKAARSWVLGAVQESYLIFHVCTKTVSMHIG